MPELEEIIKILQTKVNGAIENEEMRLAPQKHYDLNKFELAPLIYPFTEDIELSGIELADLEEVQIEIKNKIEESGLETCAFYRSYHFYPSDLWGIYIYDSGAFGIAKGIYDYYQKNGSSITIKEAFVYASQILFTHEFFHFLNDSACTKMEIITREPKYLRYFKRIYEPSPLQALEESLANNYVWGHLQKTIDQNYLFGFLSSQPGAYGRWEGVGRRRRELANIVQYCSPYPPHPFDYLEHLFYQPLCEREEIPCYILMSPSLTKRYIIRWIQAIPENRFRKTSQFEKSYSKLHPEIQKGCSKRLSRLSEPALHNGNRLKKLGPNIFEASINMHYRLILYLCHNGYYYLLNVGTHDVVDKDYSEQISSLVK